MCGVQRIHFPIGAGNCCLRIRNLIGLLPSHLMTFVTLDVLIVIVTIILTPVLIKNYVRCVANVFILYFNFYILQLLICSLSICYIITSGVIGTMCFVGTL